MAQGDGKSGLARRAARRLGSGVAFILGRPSWSAPPWARAIGRGGGRAGTWARAEKPKALALLATVLLTTGGGVALLRWWEHRPKPVTVDWHLALPEVTRIEDKVRPRPLRIEFDDSVAPLDKIDKPVTGGISFEPKRTGILGGVTGAPAAKLDGTWRWISDRELTFTPKPDWPIGEALVVRLAKKGLVASHVRLAKYDMPFTTPAFEVRLSEAVFYQDPVNPALKKVVATFGFTHPVDPATFASRVKLRLVPSDKEDPPADYEAQISYDKWKGTAYVHSAPIAIPRHDATLRITLAPGTRAARGGPPYEHEVTGEVVVPGLYNFLKITSAQISLVDNERYEPEQALIVETSVGAADKELARALRATLLPDKTADGKPASYGDPAQITPEDLKRGAPVALAAIASETEFPTPHSFKINMKVPVGRQIYVQVQKGLHAFGGYLLGETYQTIITVPPYPHMLRILQNGALLASSGDHKVPVLARDIPAIKYEIGRVLPNQIQHLVTQSFGDFARPSWSGRFDQTNVTEIFEETHTLADAPGKPEYDGLDLSKYLQGSGGRDDRRGLFLLRAQSFDPKTKAMLDQADARLILVTDLGMLVKESADGTHDVFVQSTRTGEPVSGARVEVLGKNGLPAVDATTGRDGHAVFPPFKNLQRDKEPSLYLVTSGRDQSFLPIGREDRLLNTSRFDVGGVSEEPTRGAAKGLTAYLFSDRGIYRPGDEIRVGVIVKNKDWSPRTAGLPLEVIVTDARGLPVKDQKLRLSASGFEEIRHTTPEIAPAGTYAVNLYVVKDGHPADLLGATTVQVREFLPDRMKIRAALSEENPDGWVPPGDLKARVTLANLFGTPAANRKVRAKMTLSPWIPSFGKWRDYRFFDPLRPKSGVDETLADATTNDEGIAEIDLGLKRFATATYRLSVVAEGFEAEGGRSVVAETSAVVSPLPHLVGTKADGDLAYMTRGSERHVEFIAIAPTGKRVKADHLRLLTYERKYVSVLARADNGTYRYQSVKKEVELASKPFEIAADGARRTLATDRPGDFSLVVRDAADQDLARVDYSVTGYGNLSRDVEKNAELQVALKKADVAPGDDLEMQIKAPYTGSGLITIERDHVYAWKWFKTSTTATVETIRVPEGLEGGGYVSVSFIRDPASEEVFMSPLSHGIVPFSISRARRQVKVQVETPDLARPGEPFRMKVRADQPSKAVVFAVDEGILRVADYKAPDPLAFFFQKRALSVRTAQILDMILPEFQRLVAGDAPGGDAEAAVGANLNPFRRKQQKPVAFWSGIVDVGPKEREIVYDVPDSFNGTLRVMAVAVAPEALGAFERRALVRGDFVISPNVPTFLAPGDETEVSVSVANNVAGSGKENVTLALAATAGIEPLDGAQRQLTIAELREGSASFKLRARAPVGPATLTFTASLGAAHARLASELSVRPAVPYLATFQAGHLRNDKLTVPIARRLYGELRQVGAGISHLPLGLTHGLRGYLEKFPHGCTEQIVSQAVPPLILGKHAEFGYAQATSAAAIERWIGLLRGRQNEDGSFGRWAANPAVDKLASVWAVHMLIEAKERGFAVPADVVKSATAYLQSVAATDVEGLGEAGVRAYATYVLARGGMVPTSFLAAEEKHLAANHPKEWRSDLAGLYLAATYRLLKQDGKARAIVDGVTFGRARAEDSTWYYDRLAYDAQALYIIARHFPERAARITTDEIDAIVDPIFRGSYNTFTSAWSILALEAYAQTAADAAAGALGAEELTAAGQARALTLPPSLLPVTPFSQAASAIRFSSAGPYGAYWVVSEAGFDAGLPDKPEARAIEVFRTYETADGKPATSVKLGDELTATIRVRTVNHADVTSLAIVDLLPGGFEPVIQAQAAHPNDAAGDGDSADNEGGDDSGEGESEGESEGASEGAAQGGGDGDVTAARAFALSVALPDSTFEAEFGDVREDRVVLYGGAGSEAKVLKYAVKATNVGTYTIAPIQATALYDSTVRARGVAGKITVVPR